MKHVIALLAICISLLSTLSYADTYYKLYDSYLSLQDVTYDTYTDTRDSQSYKIYKVIKPFVIHCIDSNYCLDTAFVYMFAENARYITPNSKCHSEGCTKYGRYYPKKDLHDVCPSGWNIPTSSDANIVRSHIFNGDTIYGTADGYIRRIHTNTFPSDGTKIMDRYMHLDDFPSGWFAVDTQQFKYSGKIGTMWTSDGNTYHPAYIDFGLMRYDEMDNLVKSSGMEANGNLHPVKCHKAVFKHKVDTTKIVPRTYDTGIYSMD